MKKKQIRAVHELCFPDEKSGDEEGSGGRADADWLQRATFCHEPADCAWILLYELDGEDEAPSSSPSSSSFLASWLPFLNKAPAASSPSEEEQQQQQQMKKKGELVGLVAGVPYSSSLFGFGLGVAPRLRGRGLGARLMHSLQAAARARNLSAISATVEGGKRGLVEYYKGHGGVVESAGELVSFFSSFRLPVSLPLSPSLSLSLSLPKKLETFHFKIQQVSPPQTPPLRQSSASSSASTTRSWPG